jgi:hypothetical protein
MSGGEENEEADFNVRPDDIRSFLAEKKKNFGDWDKFAANVMVQSRARSPKDNKLEEAVKREVARTKDSKYTPPDPIKFYADYATAIQSTALGENDEWHAQALRVFPDVDASRAGPEIEGLTSDGSADGNSRKENVSKSSASAPVNALPDFLTSPVTRILSGTDNGCKFEYTYHINTGTEQVFYVQCPFHLINGSCPQHDNTGAVKNTSSAAANPTTMSANQFKCIGSRFVSDTLKQVESKLNGLSVGNDNTGLMRTIAQLSSAVSSAQTTVS